MKKIALFLLIFAVFFVSKIELAEILEKVDLGPEFIIEVKNLALRVSQLEKEEVITKKDLEDLKKKNVALEEIIQDLRKQVKNDDKINEDLPKIPVDQSPKVNEDKIIKEEPDLEERVEKLENLSKVGTLRSCEEYAAYGIVSSGIYPIDPDGILIGQPPFNVYCRFNDKTGEVTTEVLHNFSETLTNVDHCHAPCCYAKNLTYFSGNDGKIIDISQLEALISLSSECEQSFYYECTLAPLRLQDVDRAFWIGRDGQKNVYFTGSDSLTHACDCYYGDGCRDQELYENSCNCDSNVPTPLLDTGVITNSSALPVMTIAFGGLEYEIQQAYFTIGRLVCSGKNFNEHGTSCRSLKLDGETKSGYYNIKKENSLHTSTVYCDFDNGGYENVPEFKELSSDAPLGTITAWIPRKDKGSNENLDLPDGWLPCDGREIQNGPWSGGLTPNLNTEGHFLRGSNQNNVLDFEEDAMQDHEHIDSGHLHSSSPHSHSYTDSGNYNGGHCTFMGACGDWYKNWYNYQRGLTTSDATVTINSANSNIGGITSAYRKGSETRPKNMKIMWIMKCW